MNKAIHKLYFAESKTACGRDIEDVPSDEGSLYWSNVTCKECRDKMPMSMRLK